PGHAGHATAQVVQLHPPGVDWFDATEGVLALDCYEVSGETPISSRSGLSRTRRRRPELKAGSTSDTVPVMPPRERRARHGRAAQRQRARAARRVRRIVGSTVLATTLIVTLLVTAF